LKEADIAGIAHSQGSSIEETARKVRYQFLFEQALKYQAQAVAVAHTADDQIETVLMHLLRGAGLAGLKGMNYRTQKNPWSNVIALVRPLLGVFRDEVLDYCTEWNLHPAYDCTNLDITFFRNRIRNELIPELKTYNAGIKLNLLRMTQTLAQDDQALDLLTQGAWEDTCVEKGEGGVALKVDRLLVQPLGIQRRLIRQAISILRPGLRDIDFATVEKALSFVSQPTQSKQCDLANGLCLLQEGRKMWIANWAGDLPTDDWPQINSASLQLAIPGYANLSDRWRIQASPVDNIREAFEQALDNNDPYQAWIDLHDIQPNLSIRSPLPGDRFQPLGLDGQSIKLSDFFINVKVPRRIRNQWPLVCVRTGIVWIPGYRIAHPYRLTSGSTQAIFLRLFKD
jgi:tRNA(Ile)-lysidine synthase